MKNILQSIGFTKNQERIYLFLVREGAQKASVVAKSLGMQRALAYRTLEELMEQGMVTCDDSTKIITFAAAHPTILRTHGTASVSKAQEQLTELEKHIGTLTSDYNLVHGKPGVEFFEGLDGLVSILNDTLTSSEVVYTYIDIDTIIDDAEDINADYAKRRQKLGVAKRFLVRDTPLARKRYNGKGKKIPNTEIRFLTKKDMQAFNTTMHIYDGKVSYVSTDNNGLTATLISNPSIYSLHRNLFEDAWERVQVM